MNLISYSLAVGADKFFGEVGKAVANLVKVVVTLSTFFLVARCCKGVSAALSVNTGFGYNRACIAYFSSSVFVAEILSAAGAVVVFNVTVKNAGRCVCGVLRKAVSRFFDGLGFLCSAFASKGFLACRKAAGLGSNSAVIPSVVSIRGFISAVASVPVLISAESVFESVRRYSVLALGALGTINPVVSFVKSYRAANEIVTGSLKYDIRKGKRSIAVGSEYLAVANCAAAVFNVTGSGTAGCYGSNGFECVVGNFFRFRSAARADKRSYAVRKTIRLCRNSAVTPSVCRNVLLMFTFGTAGPVIVFVVLGCGCMRNNLVLS